MKIWWCDYHYSGNGRPDFCDFGWFTRDKGKCRMVQMELTPVDSTPASYDIEIPDFVNRNSMGW